MNNYKLYGKQPYQVAVIHGGPGAAGEMALVAKHLSSQVGVVEPFQRAYHVQEQVSELKDTLAQLCTAPITLIGYSWGAMLSILVAAEYPKTIGKLILVGCPPLESNYAVDINNTRMQRLSVEDQNKFTQIAKALLVTIVNKASNQEKVAIFKDFKPLIDAADTYNPLPIDDTNDVEFNFDIFESVWEEAAAMRDNGEFVQAIKRISCPVIFIHGDYDPHPLDAVQAAADLCEDARIYVLPDCGHTPWIEKEAQDKFYEILVHQLKADI